jgi:hypothetical protein
MVICPEASKAQNNIAAVSADGRTVCVFIRRFYPSFEFFVQTFDGIGRSDRFPLLFRKAGEGEESIAGFLQALAVRVHP